MFPKWLILSEWVTVHQYLSLILSNNQGSVYILYRQSLTKHNGGLAPPLHTLDGIRFKVLGCFKIGNKALQTVLCISEGVMAMAMEPMLAAQVGKLEWPWLRATVAWLRLFVGIAWFCAEPWMRARSRNLEVTACQVVGGRKGGVSMNHGSLMPLWTCCNPMWTAHRMRWQSIGG